MESAYLGGHASEGDTIEEVLEELREIKRILSTLTRLNMRLAELILDLQSRVLVVEEAKPSASVAGEEKMSELPDFVVSNPWLAVIAERSNVR